MSKSFLSAINASSVNVSASTLSVGSTTSASGNISTTASFLGAGASVSGSVIAASFGGNGAGITGLGKLYNGATLVAEVNSGNEFILHRVNSASEGGQITFNRASDDTSGWYIDLFGNTASPNMRWVDSTSTVRMTLEPNGKLTAASFVGDGSGLTGITGGSSPTITNTASNTTFYPTFAAASSGGLSTIYTSAASLTYNASTGTLFTPILRSNTINASVGGATLSVSDPVNGTPLTITTNASTNYVAYYGNVTDGAFVFRGQGFASIGNFSAMLGILAKNQRAIAIHSATGTYSDPIFSIKNDYNLNNVTYFEVSSTGVNLGSNIATGSVQYSSNAANVAITNDVATSTAQYVTFTSASTGNAGIKTTAASLTYTPSTGRLTTPYLTATNDLTVGSNQLQIKDYGNIGTLTIGRYVADGGGTFSEDTLVGTQIASFNTTRSNNAIVGARVAKYAVTLTDNAILGYFAMGNTTATSPSVVSSNVLIGKSAGSLNNQNASTVFSNNVFLGTGTGTSIRGSSVTVSGNVLIGYSAGPFSLTSGTFSNKLYINNANSDTPLIYGEFDNQLLTFNGSVTVTGNLNASGTVNLGSNIATGSVQYAASAKNLAIISTTHNATTYIPFVSSTSGTLAASATASLTYNPANSNLSVKLLNNIPILEKGGSGNIAIGALVMNSTTTATDNLAIGYDALDGAITASRNTVMGRSALYQSASVSSDNVAIGYAAGPANSSSSDTVAKNIFIGALAGNSLSAASGNIIIGYSAGPIFNVNNKLYIHNDSTNDPLILGDFSASTLKFNGSVTITGSLSSSGTVNLGTNVATGSVQYSSSAGFISASNVSGSVTSATNAANVSITNDTSTPTAQYLVFTSASTGNVGLKTDFADLKFTPSTGILESPIFSGNGSALTTLTGANVTGSVSAATNAASATIAATATSATNSTNVAITDTTGAGTFYPAFVGASTGNAGIRTTAASLTYVPSTGTLTAPIFSGNGSALTSLTGANVSGSVTSALTAASANNLALTPTTHNATTYIPFFSASSGTSAASANAALTFNPTTGLLTASGITLDTTSASSIWATSITTNSVAVNQSSTFGVILDAYGEHTGATGTVTGRSILVQTYGTDAGNGGVGAGGGIIINAGGNQPSASAGRLVLTSASLGFMDNIAIGNTTPASAKFTTASTSGNITTAASFIGAGASTSGSFIGAAFSASAGTNARAPITIASGVNLTNAAQGAFEFDTDKLYFTQTATTGRGRVQTWQHVRRNSTASTTGTALVAAFDTANDTLTLEANKYYEFEGFYHASVVYSSGGANFLNVGFTFSNAPAEFWYVAEEALRTAAASVTRRYVTATTATQVTTASAATTVLTVALRGAFKSNATTGGTIIPGFSTGTTAGSNAANLLTESSFRITKLGAPTDTLIAGGWA